MIFRLPHAPVPSRPDYSRSLEYDDFRSMKRLPKPVDPHKIEHWDMSFWVESCLACVNLIKMNILFIGLSSTR